MGWLIALGILALIAIIPIGVSASYDAQGPLLLAVVGPVRVQLIPARRQKESSKKKQKSSTTKPTSSKGPAKKKGGNLQDFLPLLDAVLDFVSAFGRKLRITKLNLKLILASDDPADLALNYGKAWAALGNVVALLENAFVIKNRDLEVECDFQSDSTTIVGGVDLSITVGHIFALLIMQGVPVVKELMKILKLRKGGAKA